MYVLVRLARKTLSPTTTTGNLDALRKLRGRLRSGVRIFA